ncbi:MAG TPA: hypothetical protein PKW76_06170 [bacterium]|nr:hypothetical protein [bacterium]HPG45244.1 hypothetical protein [bacterium]HPM99037.1 hypothetical protein [bacterium]
MKDNQRGSIRLLALAITILMFLATMPQEVHAQWVSKHEENMDRLGAISTKELVLYGTVLAVATILLIRALNSPETNEQERTDESAEPVKNDQQRAGETTEEVESGTKQSDNKATDASLFTPALNENTAQDAEPVYQSTPKIFPVVGFAMASGAAGGAATPSVTLGVAINF